MATIRKRGEYQWQAIVKRKGFPLQSKTFELKKDAEAWARKTERQLDAGEWRPRDDAATTTLTEALNRYAREVTPGKKGAAREVNRIKAWQAHPLAKKSLASVRGKDVAEFRDAERKRGMADATIRLALVLLSSVFETARKEWGMETLVNPVRLVRLPSGSRQRNRRLEAGEEEFLLKGFEKSCRNLAAVPIVKFAIATSMRQGEILGLRWEDVDLGKGVAHLSDTKNGAPRDVPLSSEARAVLKAMPRSIEGGKAFRMTQDAIVRAFRRACECGRRIYAEERGREPPAGFLEDLRFHDLRHEATSRLFESEKFDMMEVAAITGHKTLAMLKRYTHLKATNLARKLG
jgi:integrase